MLKRTTIILAAAAAALFLATACGGDSDSSAVAPRSLLAEIPSPFEPTREQADRTLVGPIGDGTAYIGLVIRGGAAVGYVCDGEDQYGWLDGTIAGGRIDLQGARGIRVEGRIGDSGAQGTVDLGNGRPQRFTAAPAEEGTTGLFRSDAGGVTLGWILLESGIRGVASDDTGAKVGFAVKEDTGGPGDDSGPGDVGDAAGSGGAPPSGSGGEGSTGGGGGAGSTHEDCVNVVAGGCRMSCADLKRLLETQTLSSTAALIRVQLAEKGCR